jgi:hypothetical protein
MKRLCASLSLVAAFATVAVMAAPAMADTSSPDIFRGHASVDGLNTVFGPLPARLVDNYKGDPVGFPFTDTNVQGHFRTTIDATSIGLGPHEVIAGVATCLNVTRISPTVTRAVTGGMITFTTQPTIIIPGSGVIGMHVDNGQGANDPPDTVDSTATNGVPPPACPPSFTFFGQQAIDRGNWTIQDRFVGPDPA